MKHGVTVRIIILLFLLLVFFPQGILAEIQCPFPSTWIDRGKLATPDNPEAYLGEYVEEWGGDPENFHIVGLVSDPFVLYENGVFRM